MSVILPKFRYPAKRVISQNEGSYEKQRSSSNCHRDKYSAQSKEQALEHAEQDGVPKAAKDLRIAQAMLYSWQAKSR